MKNEMETLSQAMNRLISEGYNSEITQDENQKLNVEDWLIDKTFRFEGNSNPSDNSILYAISKIDGTRKSLLVNAYGVYGNSALNEIINNLKFR